MTDVDNRQSVDRQAKAPRGAVAKALDILYVLGDSPDGLRLGEIAERSGLQSPTTYRTLAELTAGGFCVRGSDDRYRIGPGLLRIAASRPAFEAFKGTLRATLERIVATTDFIANVQVLEFNGSRVVESVRPARYRSLVDYAGELLSVEQTAGGHVLTAYAHPQVRQQVLDDAAMRLGKAEYDRFVQRIEETTARGSLHLSGALDSVMGAVAVPVHAPTGECWLVLAGAGLITDLTGPQAAQLEGELKHFAQELSRLIYEGG